MEQEEKPISADPVAEFDVTQDLGARYFKRAHARVAANEAAWRAHRGLPTVEAGPLEPQPPSPAGAADLLERQIASCATLIGTLTDYIVREDTHPQVCMNFMDKMASLLESSASAGKVVGGLRNGAMETVHRMIIQDSREGRGRGSQS